MNIKIIETDPGERGNTAQGGTKPATLETGLVVQVTLFVNQGEKVKIDTIDNYCLENKIENIDIIKIDPPGYEDKVLQGC